MPIYTLHNKKTGETSQVSCPYDEMKKRLNDDIELVPVFPKIVTVTGSLLSKTDDGWKDNLKRIKEGSGAGNTIKT